MILMRLQQHNHQKMNKKMKKILEKSPKFQGKKSMNALLIHATFRLQVVMHHAASEVQGIAVG